MDTTYNQRMESAIRRAMLEFTISGWYSSTESAADAFDVSLPELQRILEPMLIDSKG